MRLQRRRLFGPPWRPGRRARPAVQAALVRLQQAHRLLAQGDYAQSASIFGELADGAVALGLPRAPQLALQAGRAWVLAGDLPLGMERLRQGFTLWSQTGPAHRLPATAARVLAELRDHGHAAEADALENEIRALAPGADLRGVSDSPAPAHPRLPAKCPYCGGSVNPEAVDWLDESSAACEYCGSTLQTEG